MKFLLCAFISVGMLSVANAADKFASGPVITGFGKHAQVDTPQQLNADTKFKIAFDVGAAADAGKINRKFDSLARFINMHVANGVKKENIQLALVVHGKASFDLLSNAAYQAKYSQDNPNAALLSELAKNQVQIYICGQSAVYYGIENDDLHPSVTMALSAMTTHGLLAQEGYSSNPF